MKSVTDALISTNITSKKIETHLKDVLPLSAKNESTAYVMRPMSL